MKIAWRAAIVGATLMTLAAPAAYGADMYGGSLKDSYVAPPMASPAPSWYFRIDGAYGGYDDPVMIENGIDTLSFTEIDGSWSLGGGVGRYFSQSVRGDLTYERRFEANAEGTLANINRATAGTRKFDLSSHLFLANLYYDFDNSSAFTPYLGVGLGFVRHTTGDGILTHCDCTGTIQGESNTDVAAALMGGFSVALRDRLKFDAGYRFLYLGSATTGPLTATTPAGPVDADDPTVEDIHAHEVRVGLRYDFR